MPNVMTALKAEIVRLARKEAKAAVDPVRKSATEARRALTEMKRRVDDLEQQVQQLRQPATESVRPPAEPDPSSADNGFSGRSVRSLRRKLGLSQRQFAELLGVGNNTVYKWESRPGMLKLAEKTKAALMEARGMEPRDAKKRVEALEKEVKDGSGAAGEVQK